MMKESSSVIGALVREGRYSAVYDAHHQGLLRFSRGRLGGRLAHHADTVVSLVWLRVMRFRPSYPSRREFAAYLRKAARNVIVDLLRARKPMDTLPDEVEADPVPGPGEAEVDELRERLEAALAALPEDLLVPWLVTRVEGLPPADAARELGLSWPALRKRLSRADRRIREILGVVREPDAG